MVQRGVTANAGSRLRPLHKEMKDMRFFDRIVSEKVSEKVSDKGRLFQLERKVEERKSGALRYWAFHVIRLQESESHTEEIINRFRTVLLFHRNTSKPGCGILSTSNGDPFGKSRLLVKLMFRRTPSQGKCTGTSASVHLSNTTTKRKGIAQS